MALPLDWRADPIVVIENDLLALLADVPADLCRRALGAADAGRQAELAQRMHGFAGDLNSGFAAVLGPTGFDLDADARSACAGAAATWRNLAALWPGKDKAEILAQFQGACGPQSCAALNEVRRVFIGGVLRRQAAHAALSEAMLAELSTLSRSIQFVAVNASIEAARYGPAGRAFGIIADEIRQLAQQSGKVILKQRS